MAIYNIVIKTGQVWSNKFHNLSFRITRISEADPINMLRIAYAVAILDGVEGEVYDFAYLNKDGTPFQWDDGWECEEPSFECKSKTYQSDLDFFKAVAPGRCPCDISKVDCWIHRI